jgi:hypothetical protein
MTTKLQRAVDSQTIQFLALPRIFNSLSADLPSGAVKLPSGELAYWRLNRNLSELKKNRKGIKDLVVKLAQAFKALVNSDSFLNHYGLTNSPAIPTEAQLATVFRNLLSINTNRVDYAAIHHGRQKPLVESIIVPLGNLVFFNAYRGMQQQPKVDGIKGKLYLTESADADKCFNFTIVSPVVKLTDFISADRLQSEIVNKIKQNLPIMAHNPKVVFDDGQFENYLANGLKELAEQHTGAGANGKQKLRKIAAPAKAPEITGAELLERVEAHARLTEEQPAEVAEEAPFDYAATGSVGDDPEDIPANQETLDAGEFTHA